MSASDRDRDAILARRKIFIASALASLAATSCDKPQPCLSQAPVNTGTVSEPQVCLKIALPPADAEPAAPSGEGDAGTDAPPMPCLSQTAPSVDAGKPPPPPPQPCLSPKVCLKPTLTDPNDPLR